MTLFRQHRATRRLPKYRPAGSRALIGTILSSAAILFGVLALILPLPFGLAGLILGIIGFMLTPDRPLSTAGLFVAAVGLVAGVMLGVMLARG